MLSGRSASGSGFVTPGIVYSCQPSASLTHAVPPSHTRPSYSQGTNSAPVLFSGSANGLVPARDSAILQKGEGWVELDSSDQYVYRSKNGTAANDFNYTAADCFFDAPLAAAQRDGKWVYLDTAGHEVTAPCYDGIYRPNHYTDEPLVFTRAAVWRCPARAQVNWRCR